MNAKERRLQIIDLLRKGDKITIHDLSEQYNISEVSVRKDLSILEDQKLLIRVKGGAILANQNNFVDVP
ncbi:MAG: DeoR family transcriptional regulator, partial [Bacteroidales bacterium]